MDPVISQFDIVSGDLLLWTEYPKSSISDFLVKSVAMATGGRFGHVGIAWKNHDALDDELFVIEATIPKITVNRLTNETGMFCIPTGVNWLPENKEFLMDLIGKPYGFMDAIRAFLGKTVKKDDQYQCAEMAQEFYRKSGINLTEEVTPSGVAEELVTLYGKRIYRVI